MNSTSSPSSRSNALPTTAVETASERGFSPPQAAIAASKLAHHSQPRLGQPKLARVEQTYSVIAWLFFTTGIDTIVNDSTAVLTPLRYSIFIIAFFFLCARAQRSLRAFSKGGLLWVVVGLAAASFIWSVHPDKTIDSVRGELLPMTAFALYFSSRFNMRSQMRIICVALGIAALLSMFYAIAIPSVGVHIGGEFDGAWKGIYPQKNTLSSTMTLTMLIFYILSIVNNNSTEKLIARGGLAFSIALILLSTSKSALVIFVALLLVVMVARIFRWRGRRSVLLLDIGGLFSLGAIAVFSVTWQAAAAALGKDPTLSARTVIWAGAFDKILEHPLLGWGRAAFWFDGSRPAWEVGALTYAGFVPSHAHNGYLDIGLDIGFVGLGMFFLGLIVTLGIALRRAYRATEPEDLWPLSFLILMMLYNITESLLMQRITIYWVMYMVVFLSLRIWPRRTGQTHS